MSGKRIRVLIADDHTIVRSGVRLLLEGQTDMEVVGEALTGDAAVEMAKTLQPDVVLMDISMPGLDGMQATRRIKEKSPLIGILVLTMHRSDEHFFAMLQAGASGYVLKAAETNELLSAIRSVARGEAFLYPAMAKRLMQDYLSRTPAYADPETSLLTPREKEILRLIGDGYTNKEIAERLVLSPSTVHSHRNNLMRKLDLNTQHGLIQYARDRGWVRGGPDDTPIP
jgi:two-component system, NarL family, response regulator NreC